MEEAWKEEADRILVELIVKNSKEARPQRLSPMNWRQIWIDFSGANSL